MGHEVHKDEAASAASGGSVVSGSRVSVAGDRIPPDHGARVWIAAALSLALFLGGLEVFWRAQGFAPSVTDGEDLWSLHWERLAAAPPETVAILGRSRIQQAFVPEVFSEAAPGYGYLQLAIGGLHPIGTLFEIADNSDFRGVVLVSTVAESLLPETWGQQDPYHAYYRTQWGPLQRSSRRLKTLIQQRLTVMLPELILQRALPSLVRGGLEPQFLRTRPDRTQVVDYHRVDVAHYAEMQFNQIDHLMGRYAELPGYAAWPAGLEEIEARVCAIQDRGGRVVFVRAPTSGAYREREARTFPRERFWDVFAAQTSALTLHFEDLPGMRDMICAEGAHLHREDTYAFTRILFEALRMEGVL